VKKFKLWYLASPLVLSALSTTLISAKIDFESEDDKDEKYVLYDYIKLTGKQDAVITHKNFISGGIVSKGKMYWFNNDKGYSILDTEIKRIVEVNPNKSWEQKYANKILKYNQIGKIEIIKSSTRDKTISGDRKRTDWEKIKDIEKYKNFKYSDYLNVKNAIKDNFGKYQINQMKNGLVYADKEVPYSWWFKSSDFKNFGLNSRNNSYNEDDDEKFHYYKQFKPYYKEKYLQKSNGGICGYVAVTMLLLYNEYFKGAGYFDEYEKEFILKSKYFLHINENNLAYYISNFVSPELNSNFLKYLYQKTWFANGTGEWWNYKYISESILYNKWKKSQINYSYWGNNGVIGRPWDIINEYNIPTTLAGLYSEYSSKEKGGHAIVAYGVYNDGRFLCNFGWDDEYNQVIVKCSRGYRWDSNFAINHKWGKNLIKYFNYNDKLYTGIEIDNILKEKEFIK